MAVRFVQVHQMVLSKLSDINDLTCGTPVLRENPGNTVLCCACIKAGPEAGRPCQAAGGGHLPDHHDHHQS